MPLEIFKLIEKMQDFCEITEPKNLTRYVFLYLENHKPLRYSCFMFKVFLFVATWTENLLCPFFSSET